MRQYQPIWEQIKKNKTATLIAPVENHPLIKTAVHKEKSIDMAFKLTLSELEVKLRLVTISNRKKRTITFNLVDKSDIKVEDL